MYGYARNWERGAAAGADATRGAKREYSRGPLIRRCRFHSDKLSLRGHHTPLTLAERGKLDRWMRR